MDMNIYHNKPISEDTIYRGVGEYYDPEEITISLLLSQSLYSYEPGTNNNIPDFDKEKIIDAICWLKTAAENEYNSDSFRQLYNLLAAINENSVIPF